MNKNGNQRGNPQSRVANANTQKRKRVRWFAGLLSAVLIGLIVGGYFYINRERGPVTLKVGAGPYRSDSYELMKEMADVVSRNSDRLVIEVVATGDSSQNIALLNQGKTDLATIRSDTPVVNQIRMIAELFPDYFQLITRADSGIYFVNDLEGKRIAIPDFGTDEFRSFWVIGDHYDLSISNVKWKAMAFEKAVEELLQGRVDALFTVRSLRDRLLLNLFADAQLKKLKLRFIELDQAEAIAIKRPFLNTGEVPKGAFLGAAPTPRRNMKTAVVNRVLVTRENVDAEAIRELTSILFEHRLDLTIRFALASAIIRPNLVEGVGVPLHEGAEQYFNRDQPSFVQENAEPIALMITVFAMLGSGLIALRSRFMSTQKDRMDSYNYILLDIADKARVTNDLKQIKEFKNEMFSVLEKVVRALDTDEVTEEGFQSFSLLWESVREMLNDRTNEISSG